MARLKRYLIERELPGIGATPAEGLREAAETSNKALAEIGPSVQWQHSYVAGDKTFCIYLAEDEAAIRRHAELSGFPATRITEIPRIIDPVTAQA
ncbi:DUF4242 domain-containing protein [Glycocaulis profundi]|nr:DUF4242 domain-containing protein [Glycocaulis profundi]